MAHWASLVLACMVLAGCAGPPCIGGETSTEIRWREEAILTGELELDWQDAGWPRHAPLPFSVAEIGWQPEAGVLATVGMGDAVLTGWNETHAALLSGRDPGIPGRADVVRLLERTTDAMPDEVDAWADAFLASGEYDDVNDRWYGHRWPFPLSRVELDALWSQDGAVHEADLSDPGYRQAWRGNNATWLLIADELDVPCDDAYIDIYGHGVVMATWEGQVGRSAFRSHVESCLAPMGVEVPSSARVSRFCG